CFDNMVVLLADESAHVRRAVVEHLPYFEDPRRIQALARGLRDGDPGVRAAAARALAHVEPEHAATLVEAPLRDADARARYHAAQAVGTHKVRSFAPVLRALLADDSAMPVRIASAIALGELQDAGAVEELTSAAEHPEADLACPAIIALGRIPRADAQAVIEGALFGGDPRRQLAAVQAVGSRPEYSAQLERVALSAHDPRVIGAAFNALVASGEPEAIRAVIDACAREDRRVEGMNALAHAADADIPVLARGLRHPDARVRWAVVQALGRLRHGSATRELSVALEDQDSTVRFAAAQALGRLDMLTDQRASDTAPLKSTG
ncbi:MAG TPA: HEAT repeat domain-containing protein, partial [Longimicrobiales bacterium]|nr:HEAT repeat domain-containing protein [Longimicrobiales bacterium]